MQSPDCDGAVNRSPTVHHDAMLAPPADASLAIPRRQLGLSAAEVRHAAEHDAWTMAFAQEAMLLREALGAAALRIEHVGSTAVPALIAKPILDLLVAVARLADADELTPALQSAGYNHRAAGDSPQRRYFVKGSRQWRLAHLSVVALGSEGYREQIAFRDMLRGDAALVDQYATLKRDLAVQFPADREAYTEGKAAFIRAALERSEQG